jgi:hypothetical protein
MTGYVPEAAAGMFDRSVELFESLVGVLRDPATDQVSHGDLEEQVQGRGRELLRQLYQDQLDLRAAREERRQEVAGADGVERTRVEKGRQRQLITVFGPVTVTRMAYRAPGAASLHPADAVLNLPVEAHSHGIRRRAAIEAVRGSFGDAAAAIERSTGVKAGKRQVESLARAAAVDVEAFYADRRPGPSGDDVLLVMQFDGKGIVMRPEALREATAKAARTAARKLAARLSPGEKNGRKRMAELGAVYDAMPAARTAADIIARPAKGPGPPGEPRKAGPVVTGKWLTGSVTRDIPQVIKMGFSEAERRDPAHARTWVVLVDGNKQQIEAIGAEAGHRGVKVTVLIDFIHVLEYCWRAAWSFFEPGDPDAEAWVAGQARKILEGRSGQAAAAIRRRATTYGYSAAEREGADACANYLSAKKPCLDYATALKSGWPIATGIIEGACRHIVKDRMDLTGARWGLAGAEAILTLRALVSNGDFDEYWPYHLDQEFQRVHRARYRKDHELAA